MRVITLPQVRAFSRSEMPVVWSALYILHILWPASMILGREECWHCLSACVVLPKWNLVLTMVYLSQRGPTLSILRNSDYYRTQRPLERANFSPREIEIIPLYGTQLSMRLPSSLEDSNLSSFEIVSFSIFRIPYDVQIKKKKPQYFWKCIKVL
jgi:hypothetical protein